MLSSTQSPRQDAEGCTWFPSPRLAQFQFLHIVFGLLDAAMVVFGKHPDKSLAMLLQAFFSRFAIGFLAVNVSLRIHPAMSGALVGLLISLPDAFAMKSYAGILGTGLIFSVLAGCQNWVS